MLNDFLALLICEPSEMLVVDGWFGRQGLFSLNNFIETYFTCHKIHPFQVFNPVILVTFLSGAAIPITQF